MKNFTKITCLLILLFPIFNLAQESSPLVRYPSVNSDGSKIAFSYQGDLWIVSSSGGRAERLTIHEAYDGWPQWSPDDKTMYYTDSHLRVIYAYDFDLPAGEITNRRKFVQVPVTEGFPDGLTVDSEGFVWSAQWDGWRITRYDPDGKAERVIPLPVQRPTSCAFGGPNLAHLYITSARTGLSEIDRKEQPFAGDLFRIQTDFQGQQENEFEG